MSKRRHDGDAGPAKVQRGVGDAEDPDAASRRSLLKAHIIGLNTQFASWIGSQNASNSDTLWIQGAKDYLRFAEGLVEEFNDVIPLGTKVTGPPAPAAEPAPKPAFGFMAPAAAAAAAEPAPAAASSSFGFGGGLPASSSGFGFGSKPAPTAPVSFTFGGSGAKNGAETKDKDADAEPAPAAPAPFSFGGTTGSGFKFSSDTNASQPAFGSAAAAGDAAAPAPFAFGQTSAAASSGAGLFSFGGASAAGSSNGAAPFSFGPAAATGPRAAFLQELDTIVEEEEEEEAEEKEVEAEEKEGKELAEEEAGATHDARSEVHTGAPPAAAPANGDDAEGEEEGPAKFESAVTVNEESGSIVFKAKSKFCHLAKDASGKTSWEGKGVGTFMLRTRNDESKKPFVTFTTEAGRVLYIANIPKAMQVMLIEAKNAVTFSAPWAPDGTSTPTPQGVMFVFPKGMNTQFKADVEKCQATMAS